MTRSRLAALLIALSSLGGCARTPPPIPPLAHVEPAGTLRIKHVLRSHEDATTDEATRADVRASDAAERAIVESLRAAGYTVVDHGPYDLGLGVMTSVETRKYDDPEYRDAAVTFTRHDNTTVERIALAFGDGVAPTTEPNRVATLLVNAVVASPKMAAFAKEANARRDARARRKASAED